MEGVLRRSLKSKAKWFGVRKPSTGEIIATSANQIVPLKFRRPTKMLYYIHQTPLSFSVLKGDLGTRLHLALSMYYVDVTNIAT